MLLCWNYQLPSNVNNFNRAVKLKSFNTQLVNFVHGAAAGKTLKSRREEHIFSSLVCIRFFFFLENMHPKVGARN